MPDRTVEITEELLDLFRESRVEREMRLEREAALPIHDWRWFTSRDWNELKQTAAAKDEVSDRVAWTRRWNPKFNLLGEVGEELYSRISGIPRRTHFGDGGEDFPGVDVKGTSHWEKPRLLRLETDLLRASFFALVAVDVVGHRARYVGYATRDELVSAEVIEYGYGPTRTIIAEKLHRDLPKERT
jgi:hypothetical protein